MDTYQALVARQDGDRITASVETLSPSDLPPGEVTIRVLYSSVNFKDAAGIDTGWRRGAQLPGGAAHRPDRRGRRVAVS